MQNSRISHKTICDYDRLEKAFFSLHMEMTEENEIGLMNLHNHLIWHSYEPGKEPAADAILLAVIEELMEERNADISDFPAECRNLVPA